MDRAKLWSVAGTEASIHPWLKTVEVAFLEVREDEVAPGDLHGGTVGMSHPSDRSASQALGSNTAESLGAGSSRSLPSSSPEPFDPRAAHPLDATSTRGDRLDAAPTHGPRLDPSPSPSFGSSGPRVDRTPPIDRGSAAAAAVRTFFSELMQGFERTGHQVAQKPGPRTDLLFVPAPFLRPVPWRKAPFFVGRARFRLKRGAVVCTVVPAERSMLAEALRVIDEAARGSEADATAALRFDGLAPTSPAVLLQQARRIGSLVALARVVQAQSKAIRTILLVHSEDGTPLWCWLFDLVGARPRIWLTARGEAGHSRSEVLSVDGAHEPGGASSEAFRPRRLSSGSHDSFRPGGAAADSLGGMGDPYAEIALRLVTAVSAREVTEHVFLEDRIDPQVWNSLSSVGALIRASRQLGTRGFFAPPVKISDLVKVPVVGRIIAEQYSEGCFATYDPSLQAQVVTATGSERVVHKGEITSDDLVAVVGVREDMTGAVVWPVGGRHKVVPSSEAVELYAIDSQLPRVHWRGVGTVPVIRSKLHGHCGVASFDPSKVEYVPIEDAYQHLPVSCGTDAQAQALIRAFSKAESLKNPDDPRSVAFTVLPGHGSVFVEKWNPDLQPLQLLWELMDEGSIVVDFAGVPQGPFSYVESDGRMVAVESMRADLLEML